MDETQHLYGTRADLRLMGTKEAALQGADALVLVTEWNVFKSPDFEVIRESLAHPVIIDGRNQYEPSLVEGYGIAYYGIGRGRSNDVGIGADDRDDPRHDGSADSRSGRLDSPDLVQRRLDVREDGRSGDHEQEGVGDRTDRGKLDALDLVESRPDHVGTGSREEPVEPFDETYVELFGHDERPRHRRQQHQEGR